MLIKILSIIHRVTTKKSSGVSQLILTNFGVLSPNITLILLYQVNFLRYSHRPT